MPWLETAIIVLRFPDEDMDMVPDYFVTTRDLDEWFVLSQYFSQGAYKFSDDLTLTAGLHAQHLSYTDDFVIEPRAALSYQLNPIQRFSLAFGQHSQNVPFPVLFLKEQDEQGNFVATNDNLDFIRSNHYILGYDHSIAEDWRLKLEVYYQDLYDVPVESEPSSYSVINEGADFVFDERGSLVNEGTAQNVGVELTLEKLFSKGYYMLLTTSIYESTYEGSDGIERSTAFNNQFVANFLAGKEWKIGKTKRNALTFDTRIATAQGNPFTPINLEATRANGGREVLFEDQAFSQNLDNYFRWDVKFGIRLNGQKESITPVLCRFSKCAEQRK